MRETERTEKTKDLSTKSFFDQVKYIITDKENLNNLEASCIVKHTPKSNVCLPINDNFKPLGYLKNRIIKEIPKIRSPYSRMMKSGKTHRYLTTSDCDDIINEITKIIESKFS